MREEEVVRRLVGQFERQVGEEIRSKAQQRGLSVHQLVTLASIIEREALRADERPWISAVYHNRLQRGVPLEADPTVQYALVAPGTRSVPSGFWKANLAPDDLRVGSLYNTYQAVGLPPGPICSPGVASIEAAASPFDGPWMYFVARGDGSHAFAATLEEHLRNVAMEQPGR
jgi:UPF0755 protein